MPAVLTESKERFVMMINSCSTFTDFVQIDIMDGKFVPSRSISIEELKHIRSPVESEAHLMVDEPRDWIEAFKSFGSKRIIFHFEVKENHLDIIREIREAGMEPGIAVNPSTGITDFSSLVDKVNSVLFMSVEPGFYGAAFIPEVLEKANQFKKLYPHKTAGIDGGIKLDNVGKVAYSGVDYVCVGSAILKQQSPGEAYANFVKVIDEQNNKN